MLILSYTLYSLMIYAHFTMVNVPLCMYHNSNAYLCVCLHNSIVILYSHILLNGVNEQVYVKFVDYHMFTVTHDLK